MIDTDYLKIYLILSTIYLIYSTISFIFFENPGEDTLSNIEMPWRSSLYTAFLCLLFGANAVAIKISLKGFGAFTTAGLRFSIAAAMLLLWVAIKKQDLKINKGFNSVQITWYPMIFSAPFFFLCGYLWDGQMVRSLDAAAIKALLFQALAATAFGFVAWNSQLKKFGATTLHSFVFLMPVAGVFLSVLLLGEPLTGNLVVSIVLIVFGIIIVNNTSNLTGENSLKGGGTMKKS